MDIFQVWIHGHGSNRVATFTCSPKTSKIELQSEQSLYHLYVRTVKQGLKTKIILEGKSPLSSRQNFSSVKSVNHPQPPSDQGVCC